MLNKVCDFVVCWLASFSVYSFWLCSDNFCSRIEAQRVKATFVRGGAWLWAQGQ